MMAPTCVLAFLNLGAPEALVIAVVAVLLFGPKAARAMGKVGRTLLGVKKEIDDAKDSLHREVGRVVKDAVVGAGERRAQSQRPPATPAPANPPPSHTQPPTP